MSEVSQALFLSSTFFVASYNIFVEVSMRGYLFLLLFCASLSASTHKIVYLVSGPRALSTLFMRMMYSRGDFTVFSEASLCAYDRIHYPEYTKQWFRDGALDTYEQVKEAIYAAHTKGNVFVKEMSFSAYEFLQQHPEMISDPAVHFVFLVRDPHHTAISLYRKAGEIVPGMSNILGLEKLYDIYNQVKKSNPNEARVIFSEDFYTFPKRTMATVWMQLGLPYSDKAFSWEKNDGVFDPTKWNDQKRPQFVEHWHDRAIFSDKMELPNHYGVDAEGQPTFHEICSLKDREGMRQVYLENLPFYKKFREEKSDEPVPDRKLVYMLCAPRTLSTAFLRVMDRRGDFKIFLEPTFPVYEHENHKTATLGWFAKHAYTHFDQVKRDIRLAKQKSHVFVKDMCVTASPYLQKAEEILADKNTRVLLLIRNPHHIVLSLYKKGGVIPGLSEIVGMKSLCAFYEIAAPKLAGRIRIVQAEEFYGNPKECMRSVWDFIGVPFASHAFTWKTLDPTLDLRRWHVQKVAGISHKWHDRALSTGGMEQPASYLLDSKGQPTFEEVADAESKEQVRRAYIENLPYYQRLLSYAME